MASKEIFFTVMFSIKSGAVGSPSSVKTPLSPAINRPLRREGTPCSEYS